MTELIKLIILTVIWVLGLRIVTEKGMVLYSVRKYAEGRIDRGQRLFEPLVYCVWCMPSLHAVIGYALAYLTGIVHFGSAIHLAFMYPLVAMGSSFSCGMLWLLYEYIDAQLDYRRDAAWMIGKDKNDRIEDFHKRNSRKTHLER